MDDSLNKDGVVGSTSPRDHVAVLCPRDIRSFVVEMKLRSLKRGVEMAYNDSGEQIFSGIEQRGNVL